VAQQMLEVNVLVLVVRLSATAPWAVVAAAAALPFLAATTG
jgi:hypothetical protein